MKIKEAHKLFKEKKLSPVELTKEYLKKIKKENKRLNAFLSLTEKEALESAKAAEDRFANSNPRGELDGIPLAIKDNIVTLEAPTTCGSRMLEDFFSPYEATVIKKIKAGGSVLLGKTNMDEFAMGSSTETSYFGPTKNPHDLTRVPGGSSGGSAAAVAADLCLGALGSDTGGSIRQPAGFCGVVGLKPTYGRVSRYGLVAMASSLDQIGPLAKTVEDAGVLLNAIAGEDSLDATSEKKEPENFNASLEKPVKGWKIGLLEGEAKGIEPEFFQAVAKLEKLIGIKIEKATELTKILDYALACYYIIVPAEVSSNLARYDGAKYGFRVPSSNLIEQTAKTRAQGFGAEAKRRIMLGSYVLSAGYYEAYYGSAQKARALIEEEFAKAFKKYDLIISPTSPTPAFKIGEKISDPLEMYLSDIYTVPINIAGLPAMSVPCGEKNGLPIGLQIIGPKWSESKILQLGHQFEVMRNG